MIISKYEAAVLYDCHRNGNADSRYLVMDLDDCSFGICSSSLSGTVKLLSAESGDGSNLWNMYIDCFRRLMGQAYPFELGKEAVDQLLSANSAARNYILSDRALDSELFHFSGRSITCSEFERQTAAVKEKLLALLERTQSRKNDYSPENMRFIILGQAEELYFTDYTIREFFSADPLLPDARFRNTGFSDNYREVIRIGMQLGEAIDKIAHTYEIKLYNGSTNAFESIVLAQKGQDRDILQNPKFTGPIFIAGGDGLHIQIDTADAEVKIPYAVEPSGADLAEVAMGLDGNSETLFIRSLRDPAHIYHAQLTSS